MRVEPTTDRGRLTVGRILDAACVLFARQGIRLTTLDQVGRAAGVGRGQLYHFFCDKQDLVAEVVAQQVERVLAPQRPVLDAMAAPDDVRTWCRMAAELHEHAEDPVRCPIGTLVHELGEDDPLARQTLAAGFARWRACLAAGLGRVDAAGGLAGGVDADRLATGLLAAYQGGVLLAAACDDVGLLRDALAACAEPALA